MIRSILKYKNGKAYYYTTNDNVGKVFHVVTNESYTMPPDKNMTEWKMKDTLTKGSGVCQPLWSYVLDGILNNEKFKDRFIESVIEVRNDPDLKLWDMPEYIKSKIPKPGRSVEFITLPNGNEYPISDDDTFPHHLFTGNGYGSEQAKWHSVQTARAIDKNTSIMYVLPEPPGVKGFKAGRKMNDFIKNKKKEKNMNNLGLEFGKIDDERLAMSPLGVAIKGTEGFRVYNTKTEELIDVGDFVIHSSSMKQFFAIPVSDIKIGDLLKIDNEYVYLTGLSDNGPLKLVNPATGNSITKVVAKNMMGVNFYTKVVSMMDMMGGNGDTNSDSPLGKMMGGMNPMMAMMFMGGSEGSSSGSGMGDMMQMMMMSNIFKGDK